MLYVFESCVQLEKNQNAYCITYLRSEVIFHKRANVLY